MHKLGSRSARRHPSRHLGTLGGGTPGTWDHNGAIDKVDLEAFVKCWSGPAVLADTSCTGL